MNISATIASAIASIAQNVVKIAGNVGSKIDVAIDKKGRVFAGDLIGRTWAGSQDGQIYKDGRPLTETNDVYIGTVEELQKVVVQINDGVLANVITTASVECGNIGNDLNAGGSVHAGNVGGKLSAGGSVTCKDVTGSVSANGSANTGSVGGNVSAGGSVKVNGNVTGGGKLSAGGSISVQNISARG